MQQQQNIFSLDCDMQTKVDFIQQEQWTAGLEEKKKKRKKWLDWEEALKHFPNPNLHQKNVMVTAAGYWPSDLLELSESQWNHYI